MTAKTENSRKAPGADARPPVWVGHVSLEVSDFAASRAFFLSLGMREVALRDGLSVLELRGGTHLVLRGVAGVTGGVAPFDLMVDDLRAQRLALTESGYLPGEVRGGEIHSSFEVEEPSGWVFTFSDSHVAGVV
ncbi:MAG: VOC family protein [Alphaproteobacteria bacterium]|nr:VOC family protein [Alphaproteobacteria bacterium]MDA8000658.1 VOC family protein [Alphaproteobacteria bacterium]MDA8003812.1 VOC family protein [Alphaproteobacteria bacterium]MDA8005627.1 VOC family protein [Alphaproteobacteria bacterium]MDA8009108.1 VOC family protein [Alphaproteobacteria bacterium]